ncbi:hypothetical protein NUW54_g11211 [Trametes sanguinea]|uniref:Uncharacterized protein n=1 Tax=Trametes sanguinea TaxID=158606 RepID=A0ACC1NJK1_9APHY|nr:hypothetical protein NUW54_g11211 [Trametes sanguinea]
MPVSTSQRPEHVPDSPFTFVPESHSDLANQPEHVTRDIRDDSRAKLRADFKLQREARRAHREHLGSHELDHTAMRRTSSARTHLARGAGRSGCDVNAVSTSFQELCTFDGDVRTARYLRERPYDRSTRRALWQPGES